jgi:hypothetical protein
MSRRVKDLGGLKRLTSTALARGYSRIAFAIDSASSLSRAVFSMMGTTSSSWKPCPSIPLIISRCETRNSVPEQSVASTALIEWL